MSRNDAAVETTVFDGQALANSLRSQLAEEVHELTKAGHRPPCLAVVLVGDVVSAANSETRNMVTPILYVLLGVSGRVPPKAIPQQTA